MIANHTYRRLATAAAVAMLAMLYLYLLAGMGMVGPDEPRYAWVGRAMAETGDWVTPRLWGEPWYEKPPLLYWLTGAGFLSGLSPDMAPRLPVALLSLGFLAFFHWRLRQLADAATATSAVAMLATTAGWLAYSHIGVTDLPLAVFFSAAVLLCCGDRPRPLPAAACLGLAVLAKGLVPLVLFLPVLVLNYRRWKAWLRPAPLTVFALVALPWFLLCTLRNGNDMARVLFVEQTFGRFTSPALQHVQPWWFYLPVALLLLFPWFPLLPLAGMARGITQKTLAGVAIFGLVFFSLSINKLPGYLLPLLPSACALMASGLKQRARSGVWIAIPLLLLGLLPALLQVVPGALANGLRSTPLPWSLVAMGMGAAGLAGLLVARLDASRGFAVALVATAASFIWFEVAAFPRLDQAASARPVWRNSRPDCAPERPRATAYGLYYYANRYLPPCNELDPDRHDVVR